MKQICSPEKKEYTLQGPTRHVNGKIEMEER